MKTLIQPSEELSDHFHSGFAIFHPTIRDSGSFTPLPTCLACGMVCADVCVCTGPLPYVIQRSQSGALLFSTFLKDGLSPNPGWLTGQQVPGILLSLPPSTRLTGKHLHIWPFHVRSMDLNSGVRAYNSEHYPLSNPPASR